MHRLLIATLALSALALATAACGGSSSSSSSSASSPAAPVSDTSASGATGDAAAGKAIFTDKCGSCHALKDAGTTGAVGPNLDDLKPDLARVQHQVQNGGGPMPAFGNDKILTAQQVLDVSTYVSSVAGT
jgi:mono/diheme cytochrome c family protein